MIWLGQGTQGLEAHGVIAGAALGVPSIAVEVEQKLRLIAEQLGNGTMVFSPPFDPETLVAQVRAMNAEWRNLGLDYAFLPHEDLDASHILSLRLRFR